MILVNPPAKTNKDIPNLSLAYIGTISNSKIIDLNTKTEPNLRFLNHKTDILAISVQPRTFSQYKKITDLYNKKYPDTKIVSISGIIDVECCYPFLQLKEGLKFPQRFDDNLPFPNYELFDSFEIFKKNWESSKWSYPIMTSQGCPYQCIYCAAKNRPVQTRSIKNCYQELKQAKEKYNIKSFQILDDCFNFNTERIIEFCEQIKNLNLNWYCDNGLRIDKFDEKIAKIMSESGCKGISFGIESIDPDILKYIKKEITIEKIETAIKIAKKYFTFVNGFFIIGLPNSTYKKDLKNLHWALKQGVNAHFGYYLSFDKETVLDKNFYGENSKPISNEYPKKLQKRIFQLTEFMRKTNNAKVLFDNIKAILKYDCFYLPFYFKVGCKKLINKYLLK